MTTAAVQAIRFDSYQLDLQEGRLWQGGQPVEIRPKNLEVLRVLTSRPNRLVSTEDLLNTVWSDVVVAPSVVSQSILEIRRTLEDSARDPRFIETVPKRGFRFIAEVLEVVPEGHATTHIAGLSTEGSSEISVVGREVEFELLFEAFNKARKGRRQILFVTGEAGLGKTTLVRQFLSRLAANPTAGIFRSAVGHSVELIGEGEAYAPIFGVLEELGRSDSSGLKTTLSRYAPNWLQHLPWISGSAHAGGEGAPELSSGRLVRELCGALETLAADQPLVLWLEDLHWADVSTVDFITALAARTSPARLLIIGSYRPAEAAMTNHPVARVKLDLEHRELCQEVAPELLSLSEVNDFVRQRRGKDDDWSKISNALYEVSDGNPLLLTILYDHLVAAPDETRDDESIASDIREHAFSTLNSAVEHQLSHMDPKDSELLEVASFVGETFGSAISAAVLRRDEAEVDSAYHRLAHWQYFVEKAAIDGYAFQHAIFRQVLYNNVPPSRRRIWHERIADHLERLPDADSIPNELAFHWERAGNSEKARGYLLLSGRACSDLKAYRESVYHYEHALALLGSSEDTESATFEIEARRELGAAQVFATGYASLDLEENLKRLLVLLNAVNDPTGRATALMGKGRCHHARAEYQKAMVHFRDVLEVGLPEGIVGPRVFAYGSTALISVWGGDFAHARLDLDHIDELSDGSRKVNEELATEIHAVGLGARAYLQWLTGYPDQARAILADLSPLVEELPRISSTALACEGVIAALSGDDVRLAEVCRDAQRIREEHDIPALLAWDFFPTARLQQSNGDLSGAVETLLEALSIGRKTENLLQHTLLMLGLAECYLATENAEAGIEILQEAIDFVEERGERFLEADLHRLKGEFQILLNAPEDAERYFDKALRIARSQGALSMELRASMSMARLWQHDRPEDALSILQPVYDAFSEGFHTRDLREAKQLLESLQG